MNPYDNLPEHCRESVRQYVENHVPVGGFLKAIIINDLMGAYYRADDINSERIKDYVKFFYCDAPSACHGSLEAYERWIAGDKE